MTRGVLVVCRRIRPRVNRWYWGVFLLMEKGTHHVKGHDILEGYVALLVPLDEMPIDALGTAASRQTEDEGS